MIFLVVCLSLPCGIRRFRLAGAGADIVAAWLGDTVEAVHRTYAHLMPDDDDRWRKATDQFFKPAGDEGSAPDVPPGGAL